MVRRVGEGRQGYGLCDELYIAVEEDRVVELLKVEADAAGADGR